MKESIRDSTMNKHGRRMTDDELDEAMQREARK
jgi:hypothetical protein